MSFLQVLVRIQRTAHLHQADTELFTAQRFHIFIVLYIYIPPFTSST